MLYPSTIFNDGLGRPTAVLIEISYPIQSIVNQFDQKISKTTPINIQVNKTYCLELTPRKFPYVYKSVILLFLLIM